jgi:hypothetical protein
LQYEDLIGGHGENFRKVAAMFGVWSGGGKKQVSRFARNDKLKLWAVLSQPF